MVTEKNFHKIVILLDLYISLLYERRYYEAAGSILVSCIGFFIGESFCLSDRRIPDMIVGK